MHHFAPVLAASLLLLGTAFAQRPNIVLIISDDAGFADWGFMDDYTSSINPGQAPSPVPTPNLDRLRDRGVLFTDAYTAAVCSPSRAAIVTGSYQQRIGYEYNINNLTNPNGTWEGLRPEDITVFERMVALGYTTGGIGKWHLGGLPDIVADGVVAQAGNRPARQGVDEFFGILRGSRNYSVGNHVGDITRAVREMHLDADGLEVTTELESAHAGEYVTNTFGQGAIDFIDRHFADPEPFFLYVSFTAPHGPIGPSPDRDAPGVSSNYGSMVYTMDKEIGRIMDKIADPAGDGSVDITAETLIIFINDNGGASGNGTRNNPLRNWKGSTYEGGIRVPMIFAGAGVTADPGSVYAAPVHSIDLVPTCHELGGGEPLAGIDGVNLLPFVNGLADGNPHEAIVIRSEAKYGVRMGDWKLVRNSRGAAPQLFDLSTAIDEAGGADEAATQPEVVAEMQRLLTDHEVGFDKPRFHGLSSGIDSINRNDAFRLAPSPPDGGGTFVPEQEIVSPQLLNGGFEDPPVGGGAQADRYTYAEVDGWTNIGNNGQNETFIRNNLNRTSAQNAVIPESGSRIAALDTGHTIAEGEVIGFSYWWRDASNWNDASDRIGFTLFTTDDDTLGGNVASSRQYLSEPSTANSSYELAEGIHRPAVTEVGKRLFFSFRGVDGNGNPNGFARVDDITVATGRVEDGGGGASQSNWSSGGTWIDVDTGLGDTLLDIDAFPGAVLEFPVTDSFSYIAHNDMTRATGLEFMLNKIVLSGDEAGESSQSGRITGLPLLFASDLAGRAPRVEIVTGAPEFEFEIANDLVLYDDLEIAGDGQSSLTISGDIRPYGDSAILTKSGSCAATLSGEQLGLSLVTLRGGELHLDGAKLQTDLLATEAGTVLSGSGTIGGEDGAVGAAIIGGILSVEGSGADNSRTDVADELTLTDATLRLSGSFTAPEHLLMSYASLSGEFVHVDGLPEGYVIDHRHSTGDGQMHVAILRAPDPYIQWAEVDSGLSGGDAAFDADPNGDGMQNGVAFFLGAPNANSDARPLLPTVKLGEGSLLFEFQRSDAALGHHAFVVRHSSDLQSWTRARDGVGGVSITIENDSTGAGLDLVAIALPLPAGGAPLFVQLELVR